MFTDSPNVIFKMLQIATGSMNSGSNYILFAFGCVFHAILLFIKSPIRLNYNYSLLRKANMVVSYNKKTNLVSVELAKARNSINLVLPTGNLFSLTMFNVFS